MGYKDAIPGILVLLMPVVGAVLLYQFISPWAMVVWMVLLCIVIAIADHRDRRI